MDSCGARPARDEHIPGTVHPVVSVLRAILFAEWAAGKRDVIAGHDLAAGFFCKVTGYKGDAERDEVALFVGHRHDPERIA